MSFLYMNAIFTLFKTTHRNLQGVYIETRCMCTQTVSFSQTDFTAKRKKKCNACRYLIGPLKLLLLAIDNIFYINSK